MEVNKDNYILRENEYVDETTLVRREGIMEYRTNQGRQVIIDDTADEPTVAIDGTLIKLSPVDIDVVRKAIEFINKNQ